MSANQEVQILIVDDDEVCVMALKRVMKKMKLSNTLHIARDGVEALETLRGSATAGKIIPPYLILLDINMPRMNGHEFLEEVRKDPSLHTAVIFVLTTSDAPEDVMQAYKQNIAGYVVKDDLQDSFAKTLDMVDKFTRLIVFPT